MSVVNSEIYSEKKRNLLLRKSDFPLHGSFISREFCEFHSEYGIIFYQKTLKAWIVAGEPVANDIESAKKTMQEFYQKAKSKKMIVCGYYISGDFNSSESDVEKNQFKRIKIGSSTIIDLERFSLKGYQARDMRRAINHGNRKKLDFFEIRNGEKKAWTKKIDDLYAKWIITKRGPQIKFLLSKPKVLSGGRFFICMEYGEIAAVISFYSYGTRMKYYLDDMIQSPIGNRFALDFLITKTLLQLKEEGAVEVSLGLNLFAKNTADKDQNDRNFLSKLAFTAAELLSWPYNNKGLRSYKRKFNGSEAPRYLFISPRSSEFKQIILMFLATYKLFSGVESSRQKRSVFG